jgi:pimeloyl-ACP methyl ester carboxylesterase
VKLPKPNPPLLAVAGGPGISSQYLVSLAHGVVDRAIILYDPMGCGQSKFQGNHYFGKKHVFADDHNTQQRSSTSYLQRAVQDLSCLIQHVFQPNLEEDEEDGGGDTNKIGFHLFGHSLGGIIAFEYLKTVATAQNIHAPNCLSVILASTPISIAASQASKKALLKSIAKEVNAGYSQLLPKRKPGDPDDDDDDDDDLGRMSKAVHVEFTKRHECRMDPMPLLLQQTLCHLQTDKVITESEYADLQQYHATLTDLDEIPSFPPALITRGEYDFVTPENSRGWTELLARKRNDETLDADDGDKQQQGILRPARFATIGNSGHYSMVDKEELFGEVITAFLRKQDPKDECKKTLSLPAT